jgi:DNA polymerase-3 subunit beta
MIDSERDGHRLRMTVAATSSPKARARRRGVSTRTPCSCSAGSSCARGGRAPLAATDMELSLRTSLDAEVDGEGEVGRAGPAAARHRALAAGREVTIEHRPTRRSSSSRRHRELPLHTYSAEDFPRLPDVDTAQLPASTATRSSRRSRASAARPRATRAARCSPASSSGSSRASRDGRDRLVPARRQGDAGRRRCPSSRRSSRPRAAGSWCGSQPAPTRFSSGCRRTTSVFGADATWLTTRRIDGQFPNYRQLLPEQFEYELTLPREELLEVVRRVSLMAAAEPRRFAFASPTAS